MTDLELSIAGNGEVDLVLQGEDVRLVAGLVSYVLGAIYTDRLLPEGEPVPDGSTWRRGWWAAEIGSLDYTLERRVSDQTTLQRAQDSAQQALADLVTEGVCESVTVEAEWGPAGLLRRTITILRGTAENRPEMWEGLTDQTLLRRDGSVEDWLLTIG